MFRALMGMDEYRTRPVELRLNDFQVDAATMRELIRIYQEELPNARFLDSTDFDEEAFKDENTSEDDDEL